MKPIRIAQVLILLCCGFSAVIFMTWRYGRRSDNIGIVPCDFSYNKSPSEIDSVAIKLRAHLNATDAAGEIVLKKPCYLYMKYGTPEFLQYSVSNGNYVYSWTSIGGKCMGIKKWNLTTINDVIGLSNVNGLYHKMGVFGVLGLLVCPGSNHWSGTPYSATDTGFKYSTRTTVGGVGYELYTINGSDGMWIYRLWFNNNDGLLRLQEYKNIDGTIDKTEVVDVSFNLVSDTVKFTVPEEVSRNASDITYELINGLKHK